tara:strand:+ start:10 stop:690 length:681 start_codon:yes stop_codon:yes gene_type:complete
VKFIIAIPARSSSKGIKNKNIYPFRGKPLIQFTFEAANKSFIKKSYLLSDNKKIKKLSKKFNIITDYIRPKKYSLDNTSIAETMYHFYNWTKLNKIKFDYIIILQPTSPLRSSLDINNSIKIVKKYKPLSLFSISESLEHPYDVIKNLGKNKWKPILKRSNKFFRRQDFDLKSYFINGAIYITHKDLIKKKKIYDLNNHQTYIMPKSKSFEVDDYEDIKIIKKLIN